MDSWRYSMISTDHTYSREAQLDLDLGLLLRAVN